VTAVALIALACVAAAWRCGLAGLVQRITVEAEKKTPPGTVAKDITLVLTDVQVGAFHCCAIVQRCCGGAIGFCVEHSLYKL
jgi:hypothetical protein